MTYSAVTSLMSTLGQMQRNLDLNVPPGKQIESLHEEVKEGIQTLREKVGSLLVLLETSEHNSNGGKTVKRCEDKIKVAAHEAEYRIECVWRKLYEAKFKEVRREAYERLCKRSQQACDSIDSKCRELKSAHELRILRTDLRARRASAQSFELCEHSPQAIDSNNMVVRENDLKDMKGTLMETSSNETQIVVIVGMGGIGKTTFARRIYDDLAMKSMHFDILAWATMSKEYSIRKMLLQLLHCIPSINYSEEEGKSRSAKVVRLETMDDGDLAGELKKRLWRRRYLVVIDDIWSAKAWDDICQWFPDCRGSHVLLTTRCGKVATYVAPDKHPYPMFSLSAKESWELLRSKVQFSPENEEVGRKIAENCQGLPLTIIVVAGLLSKCNNAPHRLKRVAKDVKSAVFKDPARQCEKVLAMSYHYLPRHLQDCFLYFGVFPEDDEVDAWELINMWVAEGLLKEADNRTPEGVAEEYLQELIGRNLVLVGEKNFCGVVVTCKIHDLLHELCLRQARSENFLDVINGKPRYQTSPKSPASIQVCPNIYGFYRLNSNHYDRKKIRTIVYQGEPVEFAYGRKKRAASSFFKKFNMTRVLALRNLRFHSAVSTSLFDLVHLRYLSFSIESHQFLPLFKLKNLQILIVEIENPSNDKIPIDIWRMPQLRNVRFIENWRYPDWQYPAYVDLPDEGKTWNYYWFLQLGPANECKRNSSTLRSLEKHEVLEHLHTLTGVGHAWCKKSIFALMPNLKKLEIVLTPDIGLHFLEALRHLPLIEVLSITNSLVCSHPDIVFSKQGSTLPSTLRRLTLCRLRIPWESMDIVGMLPNLEALELAENACGNYSDCAWKPAIGGFLRLKFLSLRIMSFFTEWRATEGHFPVLERLSISNCCSLGEIPQEFADIPTLQVIELHDCCVHLAKSAEQIQQEQEATFGAQWTNVRTFNCERAICYKHKRLSE